MTQDVTSLIGKLLRQAEGTTHDGERRTFMDKAMLLSQAHNVDLSVARAATARTEATEKIEEQTVELGPRGTRGLRNYAYLYIAICDGYGVKVLIANDNTRIFPFGYPSDIELVTSLYQSLVVQMVAAGDAYIRSGVFKSETVNGKFDFWTQRFEQKPLHASTARQQFYVGFVDTVSRRLSEARTKSVQDAEARRLEALRPVAAITADDTVPVTASVEMVLRDKDAAVNAAYKVHAAGTGSWQGGRIREVSTKAKAAGSKAAKTVDLHATVRKPITV